ncbi:hypothetical protein [Haloplasma contractile]|uniref:O-antigen ligase like membrane protein n=1 Tax=Haloplasma contractile SSD-17B TaxID=1033810 RepID=U2E7R3_9MOLU|nr:hypothetical protein [Haloplasma contractile]ERJ10936.1 O-antigen ligase like membrane protein [Haloplasma contractile SSD-17B]
MINTDKKFNGMLLERKNLDWLWYLVVFFLSLNFMAKSNFLLLSLFTGGIIVAFYKKSRFRITTEFVLIWLFSIAYYLLLIQYTYGGIGALFTYLIGPVTIYFMGYTVVKGNTGFIFKTVLMIIMGNFIHGTLNMIKYFQRYGFISTVAGPRIIPDIWTGVEFTATIQGTKFTLMLGLLFYSILLITNKGNKKFGFLIILLIIFSLFVAFILGNRTAIAILLINFAANIVLYNFSCKKFDQNRFKVINFILFILLIIFVFYTSNIFNIKEFIQSSTWYLRSNSMELTDDPRIEAYKNVLVQIVRYPLGGYRMHLGNVNYVHNLWLDVIYATGLIPFIFLVLYTLQVMYSLLEVIRNNYISIDLKILLFSTYLAFILNFMVEPILEGVPFMFLSFCLINGMVKKYLEIFKKIS